MVMLAAEARRLRMQVSPFEKWAVKETGLDLTQLRQAIKGEGGRDRAQRLHQRYQHKLTGEAKAKSIAEYEAGLEAEAKKRGLTKGEWLAELKRVKRKKKGKGFKAVTKRVSKGIKRIAKKIVKGTRRTIKKAAAKIPAVRKAKEKREEIRGVERAVGSAEQERLALAKERLLARRGISLRQAKRSIVQRGFGGTPYYKAKKAQIKKATEEEIEKIRY